MLAAFTLGAVGTWAIMRSSSSGGPQIRRAETLTPSPQSNPPDVSNLSRAEAAKTLADWNYDRQNWSHAIDHYQETIAAGADNADIRTDLGNCFRFIGQPQKALEQYQIAQNQNPQHENSLFNQAGLYTEVLHDDQRALTIAREFLKRFPQSQRAEAARQLISTIEAKNRQNLP